MVHFIDRDDTFPTIMDINWPVFHRLDERKHGFIRAQPGISMASLENWFRTGLTYTSNAIEGNTLTRVETDIVINQGLTVSGKPIKDHKEAQNHAQAWDMVLAKSKVSDGVNEQDILDIHKLILRGIDNDDAGRYRKRHVYIGNSAGVLPSSDDIPHMMADFGAWLTEQPFTPATAFRAHLELVAIHPFIDGNGRTARLLTNMLLMKGGHLPVVIQPEDKFNYYDALEQYSDKGSTLAFANYMGEALEQTYDWVMQGVMPSRSAMITNSQSRRTSPK